MKVALELQPCCGNRSGIGNYTYEIAKRLRSDKNLLFHGNIFNFLHRHRNREYLSGIEMPIYEQASMPYGIYRRIWKWIPIRYDSLFLPSDLTVFFNYIVPPKVSGKIISVIYDMTCFRYPETMQRKNWVRLQEGLCRSIECSDHIITISQFSKQEISDLMNISEKQISVVPCAPSLGKGNEDFLKLVERYGIRSPFLLYVGTIEPRKNLVRLIHAFSVLKYKYQIPHQLVLVGGNGWKNREIYQSAEKSDYQKDILFTGFISDREKNTLYQQADLFIFPSLYEGFGIPPLEAMTFGCPVVCSNTSALPEVVGNAAELVDPMDEESIENGIWKILSNGKYASILRQRGIAQAKTFTWDTAANKLKQVCKEVLSCNIYH